MPSQDYTFDPTASNPDNLVLNEVHLLANTVAVIPLHGSFYRDGLTVEGLVDNNGNTISQVLRVDRDYIFSPIYVRLAALTGKDVYSYILIRGDWEAVRIRYQVTGGANGVDTELMTKVSQLAFDRKDITAWSNITGMVSYNPIARNPILKQSSETELLNSGIERINEMLMRMAPGYNDRATAQQVTDLEIRHSQLADRQDNVEINFATVLQEFSDLRELYYYLEDLVLRGSEGNTLQNGGYIYISGEPLTLHTINHNLNSEFVDITLWELDPIEKIYKQTTLNGCVMVDNNTVTVTSAVASEIMAIVRPVTTDSGGYLYESTVPSELHNVIHGLNSGFLSATLWVDDGTGTWVHTDSPVNLITSGRVEVPLAVAKNIRLVLQRPLPNSFLFKSEFAGTYHRISHNLMTPYVGVSVWVRNPDKSFSLKVLDVQMVSNNVIDVHLDESEVIKVLIQPAIVAEGSETNGYEQQQTILEDRLDSLQSEYNTLVAAIEDAGGINGPTLGWIHESTEPHLVHTITHDLNTTLINATLWVLHEDGTYHNDDANIVIVDNSTVTVTLIYPADIRVKLTLI